VRIEEQFDVDSSIEQVYEELNDVTEIGQCIAGFKAVQALDATHSRWKFEQRFGAIAKTFDLEATITDRQPPQRIVFRATGHEVAINGHVSLQALAAARTKCEIFINVEVVGPLAPLVEIFAKGPQKKLILQTISNMRSKLEAVPEGRGAPATVNVAE
jgi:carbon monoxide dehydrogenase subunit G